MGIQESFVPSVLVPGLVDLGELLHGSLYQVLENLYHIRMVRAVETFEPVLLSLEEIKLLDCQGMRLAFQVERVSYDGSGRPVEYVRSRMRADRYRYAMELIRRS